MRQICLRSLVLLSFLYCIGCDAVTSSSPLGNSIPKDHWLREIGGAWILTIEGQADDRMVIHLHVEDSSLHLGVVRWEEGKFEVETELDSLHLTLSTLDDTVFINWTHGDDRGPKKWRWHLLRREKNENSTTLTLYPPRIDYFVGLVEQGHLEGTVHHLVTAPMQPEEPGIASLGNDGWTEVHIADELDQLAELIRAGDEEKMFAMGRPAFTCDQVIIDRVK